MRVFFFLLLLVFIASCDPPYIEEGSHMPDKVSLANEVRIRTLVQLKKEMELYPFGIGSGMMDQIRMLALSFRYYKEVDINQARALLMTAGTLFLNTINAKEQIRPFLQNDPFQPNNIEIAIFLAKPNGSKHDPDKLTVVSMTRGILEYDVRSSENGRLTTIYEETFEEAAEKLGFVEENGQYHQGTQLVHGQCQ